jgi:hypothetical protein
MLSKLKQKIKTALKLSSKIGIIESKIHELQAKSSSQEVQTLLKLKYREYRIS